MKITYFIIPFVLIQLAHSQMDFKDRGEPVIDGYVLFPTISLTITDGELFYYNDGEIVDNEAWNDGSGGKFGKGINFDVVLPLSKNVSFMFNYLNVPKHFTIYHNEYGSTRVSTKREERWKKTTIGLKVSINPDWFR